MTKSWIYDMNYAALGTKHWISDPPQPINGSHDEYFLLNMSHNIASNLLHGITFQTYYTSTIHFICGEFISKFDTIPVSQYDVKRYSSLLQGDVDLAKFLLDQIMAKDKADEYLVQDLYLRGYDSKRAYLDPIVDIFEIMQRSIERICIPFVALRQDIRAGRISENDRPDANDLKIHLNVNGTDDNTRTGVFDQTFDSFLRWDLRNPMNVEGRKYAYDKRFFDSALPSQRLGRMPFKLPIAFFDDVSEHSGSSDEKIIFRPMYNSNGYRCVNNQCKPGAANDYCVGNPC